MWYRKAADQGHAAAQSNLGNMYKQGRGVSQSDKEAAVCYRKAADQGNAEAQYNLGAIYLEGQGVPKNIAKALSWFRKAAAQGLPDAAERVTELEAMQSSPAGMRTGKCANCGALEAPGGAALKPCAKCKSVVYCGRECQKEHWRAPVGHMNSCSAFSS